MSDQEPIDVLVDVLAEAVLALELRARMAAEGRSAPEPVPPAPRRRGRRPR